LALHSTVSYLYCTKVLYCLDENLILTTGYFSAGRDEKSCLDLPSLSEEKDCD
jgi:hypothetical protein